MRRKDLRKIKIEGFNEFKDSWVHMKIIIIGNGIAGFTAAKIIRKFGKNDDVIVISEEKYPIYSPCVFPNYLSGEINMERIFLTSLEDYLKMGIRPIFDKKVIRVYTDEKKVLLKGRRSLLYDKLVIATGSEPIIPRIEGVQKKGVLTLKNIGAIDELLAYPKGKIAIIGAGFIGVEAAIALKVKGYDVTLIESLDHVLPAAFDEKASRFIERILQKNEIKIFTREEVTQIFGGKEVEGIEVGGQEIKCDVVALATGMKPRVDLAKRAGITIGKLGGILTDERMSTSAKDVYACGDCTESRDILTSENALILLWPNAVLQGKTAGYNCVGVRRKYRGFIRVVGMDIFGVHVASIGHIAAAIGDATITEKVYGDIYHQLVLKNGSIVGAQFVGKTEDVWSFFRAILMRLRVENIAGMKREFLSANPWCIKIRQYL